MGLRISFTPEERDGQTWTLRLPSGLHPSGVIEVAVNGARAKRVIHEWLSIMIARRS